MSKKIDYLDFFKAVGKSKRLPRTGWMRTKVKDPESVAEHSFRVGVLAMVLSDKLGYSLDKEKLIKMALLHDLGEVITGDIVIERGGIIDIEKRKEKEEKEKQGVGKIFSLIKEENIYGAIFNEMLDRTTEEAKVFWQLDKLEMAIQALEYEQEQGKNLEEFFTTVDLHMKEPLLKEIFNQVLAERKRRKHS